MQTVLLPIDTINAHAMERVRTAKTSSGFEGVDWASLRNEHALETLDRFVGDSLDEHVMAAAESLEDPDQGIAVFDVPVANNAEPVLDMWIGSVTALLLSRRLGRLRKDPHTGLPFTIYNASSHGERALKANGIKYNTPAEILGFHTDGIVSGKGLCSPKFVSIYNVYIGYKKPGHFFWVPFNKWTQFSLWKEKIGSRKFKIEITPITYRLSNGELKVSSEGCYQATLLNDVNGITVPFFNGEVVACMDDAAFDITHIHEMLKSISTNPARYAIPLRSRRLFLLNNWLGAHARDIFEEPFEGVKYTRSFFRAMGEEMFAA